MSYAIQAIQAIQLNAKKQKLKAPETFWMASAKELQNILNGYGPDNWCEDARDGLTWLYRNYQEAAAIHDVRYEYATGQEEDRAIADNEFLANLRKQWKYRYGWSRWGNPVALWAYAKISLAYKAVELFGKKSYQNAFNERMV